MSRCFTLETQNVAKTEVKLNANLSNDKIQGPFGQPTAQTHPHLLKDGELIPGNTYF